MSTPSPSPLPLRVERGAWSLVKNDSLASEYSPLTCAGLSEMIGVSVVGVRVHFLGYAPYAVLVCM